MPIETKIVDRYRNIKNEVAIHDTETPCFEARLATQLIERWGMVASTPDGEDACGRQKLRLLSSDEIVTKAADTAEAAVALFRAKGWMVRLPSLAEIEAGTASSEPF